MDTQTFIVQLLSHVSEIHGRKKIQKITYIFKSLGMPINDYFRYHLYGPYSFDLQLKIDEMVDNGILLEELGERNSYKYSLNNKRKDINVVKDKILERNSSIIQNLSGESSVILELVATIFFLRNNGYSDDKLIKEKILILKPSYENKIEEAFSLYKNLVRIDLLK